MKKKILYLIVISITLTIFSCQNYSLNENSEQNENSYISKYYTITNEQDFISINFKAAADNKTNNKTFQMIEKDFYNNIEKYNSQEKAQNYLG